jgi:hypothetical protein
LPRSLSAGLTSILQDSKPFLRCHNAKPMAEEPKTLWNIRNFSYYDNYGPRNLRLPAAEPPNPMIS